jgi:hypothetical protein
MAILYEVSGVELRLLVLRLLCGKLHQVEWSERAVCFHLFHWLPYSHNSAIIPLGRVQEASSYHILTYFHCYYESLSVHVEFQSLKV